MLGEDTTYHFTNASPGFMAEVQKTSTWCLKILYSTDGMNRMWDGGVALAKISEILPCNNSKFFPASCFLSALVVLVLLGRCGFHDILFSLFSFYNLCNAIMILVTKSDFLIGYVEMTTKLKHFSTSTLYNAFRFNVLRQIMTIEWMHDNDLDQQGVRW